MVLLIKICFHCSLLVTQSRYFEILFILVKVNMAMGDLAKQQWVSSMTASSIAKGRKCTFDDKTYDLTERSVSYP